MRTSRPAFMRHVVSSTLLVFVLLAALSAEAGWLPAERLTESDSQPSCLSANNARCMVTGESTGVHLVWYDFRDGQYDIYYRYFTGFAWEPEVRVTANPSGSLWPCIAAGSQGTLHLVWSDLEDGTPEIYYKFYDGSSWGSATKLTDGGSSAETPSMAVDDSGRVHVVWREYRPGGWALYHRCYDGATWGATATLTSVGSYPHNPCITADGSGGLHLVWQDNLTPTNAEIYYRSYSDGAWQPAERLTVSEGYSEYPSVVVDSAGRIHVFWDDKRTGMFEIYHKVREGVTWGPDEVFASSDRDALAPSCSADDAGKISVVWYDRYSSDPRRIYCTLYDGGEWGAAQQIALAEGSTPNPCVAVRGRYIHAAWQAGATSEIYWRMCDLDLPAPTLVSVDPAGWLSCEAVRVAMSGTGFTYNLQAWLARAGEDSIPLVGAETLSPTEATGIFDLGPATPGYWDVVMENADLQRDTLEAGFLVEEGLWSDDVRLTQDPGSSVVARTNARGIAADSQGGLHVVWYDDRDGNLEIYYKCMQGGSWGPDTRLTTAVGSSQGPAVAIDGQDRIHIVWYDHRDGNDEIYYKSFDGVAWGADERLTQDSHSSTNPAIAIDSADRIWVIWQDDRIATAAPDIYVKMFDGSTWGSDQLLYDGANGAGTPTIAADDLGQLHTAWYVAQTPNLLVYRKFDGSAWAPHETLAAASNIWTPSIAAGPEGNVHIAWHDQRYPAADGSYEIFYMQYNGVAWEPVQRITEAPGISQHASVTAAPDGAVHIVWSDERWGKSEIYHGYFDGIGWSLNARLTRAPGNSIRPTAVSDAEGNIHVVWQDERDGNSEIYYKMRRAGTTAGANPGQTASGLITRLAVSPNPAFSGATLRFTVAKACRTVISVYDVSGRLVWRQETQVGNAGSYEVAWDRRDLSGRSVSAGVYFCRVTAGRDKALAKLVLID